MFAILRTRNKYRIRKKLRLLHDRNTDDLRHFGFHCPMMTCHFRPSVLIFLLHRRGTNNPLMLQNSSTASHRKFQDMADNVCEVKSTLTVHHDSKSTVSELLLPV